VYVKTYLKNTKVKKITFCSQNQTFVSQKFAAPPGSMLTLFGYTPPTDAVSFSNPIPEKVMIGPKSLS